MDDKDFQDFVQRAVGNSNERKKDLARSLEVSFPTVERWINGSDAPHPEMRTHAIETIESMWGIKP